MLTKPPICPTRADLTKAHRLYWKGVPRDLFYRGATDLVELSLAGQTSITVGEAVAILLQTWNRPYYRYHPAGSKHYTAVDALVQKNMVWFTTVRNRSISSFAKPDERRLLRVFANFAAVLGPVGAAKALHLLAPHFFPLWDDAIAKSYGVGSPAQRTRAQRYVSFIWLVQAQALWIERRSPLGRNPLKAIDEYNYCHFTKGWM